jgi:hypothetical protein
MLTHFYTLVLADATAATSNDRYFGIDSGERFPLFVITIIFGTGLIITIVGMLSLMARSIHHRRLETDLKRDLLDRGMSAEEVARVVEASAGRRGLSGRRTSRGGIE